MDFRLAYLASAQAEFSRYKHLGMQALEVLSEEELNHNISEANSAAIIVKHLHGNMKSRWVNLFTEDGEKPDRHRDREFTDERLTKQTLIARYNDGWAFLEQTLSSLKTEDFARPVFIRGEAHSLLQAINRQISHYAYHVGQLVLLAKQFRGSSWVTLSVAKGQSAHARGDYTRPQ